ncbi:MAG: GGDEF domain-containing protein [Desulfobacteraceae bacterium]
MTFQKNRLNRRVVKDLKQRSTIGIGFYILLACIVLFTDSFHQRHPLFASVFLFSTTAICLFRVLHLLAAKWSADRFETLNNRIFITSVIVTAMIWGTGFLFFMFLEGEHSAKLLMSICTAGLSAGGVVAFLPHLLLALVYNFATLLPAGILMLATGSNVSIALTIDLFVAYLTFTAYRGNKEYWQALENEFLLEKKSKTLETMSMVDVLTGLYNRRYFDEQLKHEWKRAVRKQTAIIMIIADIDHFKAVNDTFGHLAGDEFLKNTAALLTRVFQRKTDIVARYGGEEFVMVLPEETVETANLFAEKIRCHMATNSLTYSNNEIRTTISMGIACCRPGHHDTEDSLIFSADSALYQAKNSGRNRIVTISMCDTAFQDTPDHDTCHGTVGATSGRSDDKTPELRFREWGDQGTSLKVES